MRKWRKYFAIIIGYTLISSIAGVSASGSEIGNCDLVYTNTYYPNITQQWEEKFGNIIPREAIETAHDHLRSYCCKKGILNTKLNCKNTNEIYLESPFLFDHILDIYLRRLDAFEKTEHSEDLLYNLEPDPEGKQRRSFVVKVLEDPKGAPPMKIYNNYTDTWSLSTDPIQNLPTWNGENIYDYKNLNDDSLTLEKINISFSNKNPGDGRNLVNKYTNACEIAAMLYFELQGPLTIKFQGKEYSVYTSGYLGCKILIRQRINQENSYVKMVLAYQGNTLMKNYLHNFLNQTLVQKNMSELNEVTSQIVRLMDDVNRSVVRLVPACS